MNAQVFLCLQEAYEAVYTNLSESHFKVGDKVTCKESGMKGEVVKVDPEEKGKYYTVKREDGKKIKYSPDELKGKNGGVDKKTETKFHKKLDTLVHKTFGEREDEKKMKEEVDLFDYLLEYLVAEGYADTNQAALVIMANMSEEWKQSIFEAPGEWFGGLRDKARASRAAQIQSAKPAPKPGPTVSSPFAKPASRNDSGRLTTYGAGGGAAAEAKGQTRAQVMQQGAKNLENKNRNPGPNFGR